MNDDKFSKIVAKDWANNCQTTNQISLDTLESGTHCHLLMTATDELTIPDGS